MDADPTSTTSCDPIDRPGRGRVGLACVPALTASLTVVGGTLAVGGSPASAATLTVTNTNSSGAGSLQQALIDANASVGVPDTIEFAIPAGSMITLIDPAGGDQFKITDDVTINGPGANQLLLTNPAGDVLYVYGASLSVSQLTVADSGGEGIRAAGATTSETLSLSRVRLDGNAGNNLEVDGVAVILSEVESIDAGASGVDLHDAGSASLTQVNALSNGGDGIRLEAVTAVAMTEVTASMNGANGISGTGAVDDARLTDVTTSTNYLDGVSLYGWSRLVVDDMTAASNVGHALALEGVDDVSISELTVTSGESDGVSIEGGRAVIDSSSITGADENGIVASDNAVLTLLDTSVDDNGEHGLRASESSDVSVGGASSFSGNRTSGIYASDQASVAATGATVSGNGALGIEVSSGDELELIGVTMEVDGDAIEVSGPVDLTITGTTITTTGTSADLRLSNLGTAEVTMADSTISGADTVVNIRDGGVVSLTNLVVGGDIDISEAASVAMTGGSVGFMYVVDTDRATFDGLDARELKLYNVSVAESVESSAATMRIGSVADAAVAGGEVGQLALYASAATVDDSSTGEVFARESSVAITGGSVTAGPTFDGGVAVEEPTSMTIDDVAIDGGLLISGGADAVTVRRSTIQSPSGSSVSVDRSTGVTIENSTIVGTASAIVATDGSGVDVRHSTLSTGAASAGVLDAATSSTISLDHVAVDGPLGSGEGISATFSGLPVGSNLGPTNVESDDLGLGALGDNGGATLTRLPAADSPLVDAGDRDIGGQPPTDQRGEERVDGDAIDIGAVETDAPLPPPPSPPPSDPIDAIVSLAPARFVDTRAVGETIDGLFEAGGRRVDGSELRVPVAGRGDVPTDAVGVVMNLTAVNPSAPGFATVHPCLPEPPLAASLNFAVGSPAGNEIVAGLSDVGEVCVFVRGDTEIVIDVVGFVPSGWDYSPVDPARLADTRPDGPLVDGSELVVQVGGEAGVPDDAVAAVINVTAINPATAGFITSYPCEGDPPLASSLNFVPGVTRGNELVAPLAANGTVCLFVRGETNLAVDVAGHLPAGSTVTPLSPARFLDTREQGETIDGEFAGGGQRRDGERLVVPIAGRGEVPVDAEAVIANVTAVGPAGAGFVTVDPCDDDLPLASSLNFTAGVNGGNEIVARLDGDGELCLFTRNDTHLTLDVVAYLTASG